MGCSLGCLAGWHLRIRAEQQAALDLANALIRQAAMNQRDPYLGLRVVSSPSIGADHA